MNPIFPIRAVLFDLDGTLRHNRPSFNDIVARLAVEYGGADTRDNRCRAERWLHYYWAQSADAQFDQETYGDLTTAFWENHTRRYLIAFGYPAEEAARIAPEVYSHMDREYLPIPWVPQDAFEVLQALRAANFLVGIVSNRTHPLDDELSNLGLDGYLDMVLTAGEANSWKPDTGIFLDAVNYLHILPSEALYVGDNYYSDVVGSRNAGLHPVLLDPQGIFPEAECTVIQKLEDLLKLTRI